MSGYHLELVFNKTNNVQDSRGIPKTCPDICRMQGLRQGSHNATLGHLWEAPGSVWEPLGASGDPLGASRKPFEASGNPLGSLWEPSRRTLDSSVRLELYNSLDVRQKQIYILSTSKFILCRWGQDNDANITQHSHHTYALLVESITHIPGASSVQ